MINTTPILGTHRGKQINFVSLVSEAIKIDERIEFKQHDNEIKYSGTNG